MVDLPAVGTAALASVVTRDAAAAVTASTGAIDAEGEEGIAVAAGVYLLGGMTVAGAAVAVPAPDAVVAVPAPLDPVAVDAVPPEPVLTAAALVAAGATVSVPAVVVGDAAVGEVVIVGATAALPPAPVSVDGGADEPAGVAGAVGVGFLAGGMKMLESEMLIPVPLKVNGRSRTVS